MYAPILAVLAYVVDPKGDNVLMVHRSARRSDPQHGLYNGLGGKVEVGESPVAAMKREVHEEAGLQVLDWQLRGSLLWRPGFSTPGAPHLAGARIHDDGSLDYSTADWLGWIFLVTKYQGELLHNNNEGDLHWVPLAQLSTLPTNPGDEEFLSLVFDPNVRDFHGVMNFEGTAVSSSDIEVRR